MKHSTLGMTLAALLLAASTGAAHEPAQTRPAGHAAHSSTDHSMAGHSAGSKELHRIMMQGAKAPMPMTGNVDRDFALMMTRHHQQAIEMVDVLLRHGRNAELKAMARKMQAAQREEIKKLAPHTK